jgi:hypothetical protein
MDDKLSAIEITFAAPVALPDGFDRALAALIGMVCERYQADNPTRIMWTASFGAKPNWSLSDAQFLHASAEPDAPRPADGMPPTFDSTVYQIGCEEREDYYGDNPANPDRDRLRKELSAKHAAAREAARQKEVATLTDGDINACIKQSVQPSGLMDYKALARALESTLQNKRTARDTR